MESGMAAVTLTSSLISDEARERGREEESFIRKCVFGWGKENLFLQLKRGFERREKRGKFRQMAANPRSIASEVSSLGTAVWCLHFHPLFARLFDFRRSSRRPFDGN